MPPLPYRLNRTVEIQATPETVFRFFTDSARWAAWWGPGSTIDARSGGKVYIRHPNGVETLGEVLELHPPHEIAFTYGFAGGHPIAPGASRVTIRLEPIDTGTRLHLLHEFAEAAPHDAHIQGWRFQLSLFANAVANEVYAGAGDAVDAWYAAWLEADDTARLDALGKIVHPAIRFRDRISLLDGVDDLAAHMAAAQRFMPGFAMRRKGQVRHCQGTVLADWTGAGLDGIERVSGTSVFEFACDGRIHSVTGVTNP
jgi:uncharacterized protein YndB with AHSA1/START domain